MFTLIWSTLKEQNYNCCFHSTVSLAKHVAAFFMWQYFSKSEYSKPANIFEFLSNHITFHMVMSTRRRIRSFSQSGVNVYGNDKPKRSEMERDAIKNRNKSCQLFDIYINVFAYFTQVYAPFLDSHVYINMENACGKIWNGGEYDRSSEYEWNICYMVDLM